LAVVQFDQFDLLRVYSFTRTITVLLRLGREMIDSEVVTDSRVWDVDRGTKVSAKASGALKFYYNIDPKAEYGVETGWF